MTRDETVKIIRIMCDSYPNYKPYNLSETVDVWNMMLEEYTYDQISVALKSYILTDKSGFAPSIGQLVDKVHYIFNHQELNEMEAWILVQKAIRNSAYHAEEEFEKLPSIVQRAVSHPRQLREWATMDNIDGRSWNVMQSNFMKVYRIEIEREKESRKMSSDILKIIKEVSEDKMISDKKP